MLCGVGKSWIDNRIFTASEFKSCYLVSQTIEWELSIQVRSTKSNEKFRTVKIRMHFVFSGNHLVCDVMGLFTDCGVINTVIDGTKHISKDTI